LLPVNFAFAGKIIYKLPGHQGSVNETDFHPTEPIRKFSNVLNLPNFSNSFFFSFSHVRRQRQEDLLG
jgi:hypothetical protein